MDGLNKNPNNGVNPLKPTAQAPSTTCLLYTSDAADEL